MMPTLTASVEVKRGDAGTSFVRFCFDSRHFTWRPSGERGRANWGRYFNVRCLGFALVVQRFDATWRPTRGLVG